MEEILKQAWLLLETLKEDFQHLNGKYSKWFSNDYSRAFYFFIFIKIILFLQFFINSSFIIFLKIKR